MVSSVCHLKRSWVDAMKSPDVQTFSSQSYDEKEIQVEPTIFFGVDISGTEQNLFPTYDNHINKYNLFKKSEDLKISPIFRASIDQCLNKIWILDSYLHTSNYRKKLITILEDIALNQSNLNVRFYLLLNDDKADIQTLFDNTNEYIRELRGRSNNVTTIEAVFINDMSWLHDRFAILDNILWHFGSDVGSSNKSLHATSYGWNAETAIEFFKQLWEQSKK